MANNQTKTNTETLLAAIDSWAKKEKNNVAFVGSFTVFDKEDNVKDSRVVAYGKEEVLKIAVKDLVEQIRESKKDFINL